MGSSQSIVKKKKDQLVVDRPEAKIPGEVISPERLEQITAAMVKLGTETLQQANNTSWDFPTSQMIDTLGGRDAFLAIFTRFYERLFADPLMRTLFNETPEQRKPEEHGLLLGSFILGFVLGDGSYGRVLNTGVGHGLGHAHQRAKGCPMREKKHIGKGFTVNQSRAWLGHFTTACREKGTEELGKSLPFWLGTQLWRYGPFVED
mmetsp:Transcript_31425/g.50326  ORF Transcript_31425/g.50326 Transcript_31425/m.50326 type:complete len:205 (-) Transcript_31425:353-967(-)